MKIRNAVISELEEILAIYELARAFMKETGNPDQWRNTYPTPQIVKDDIKKEELYVLYDEEGIEGDFVFINGPDPTYDYIDGNWLDDEPYCAVHRVASAQKKKGVLRAVMDYAFSRSDSIKIDTHKDNAVMQHQLEKYGFKRCGIIFLENGEDRIAYQMKR